jgi:hypothetical protein
MTEDYRQRFLTRKIGEYDTKIMALEREVKFLKNIIKEVIDTSKYGRINDSFKSILDNMKMHRSYNINEIEFPENINADRTKRKYMSSLIFHGFVTGIGHDKWRKYVKIKDMDVF